MDTLCVIMDLMIEYCLGFAFDEGLQEVTLIEKQRPIWQAGKLNGVGGKLELRENPYFAMEREFQEETGVLHKDWKKFGYLYGRDWGIYLFTTILTEAEIYALESVTDEKLFVISISNLLDTIPNLTWLVPMAKYCLQKEEFFQINEISLH